jgi:hypothetical protein
MDLEGNDRGLIEILFRHLPARTKEYHENLSQDSLCSGRDINQEPTGCKSRTLPLVAHFHEVLGSNVRRYTCYFEVLHGFSSKQISG